MANNISNSDVYKEDESGEPVDEPVTYHKLKSNGLPNVYDYIIGPEDDLIDIINNQATAGESAIIGRGTHTISESLSPPNDFYLSILGEVTLEDGLTSRIIHRPSTNPATGLTIDGHGAGVLDGNKANQVYSGTKTDHSGIRLRGGAENCVIRGLEVRNVMGGASIEIGNADASQATIDQIAQEIRIEECYLHDLGTGGVQCDGIFSSIQRGDISNVLVHNHTDTGIVTTDSRYVTVSDCVIMNTDSYNANVGTMAQGMAAGERSGLYEITVTFDNCRVINPGSSGRGFDQFNPGAADLQLSDCMFAGEYVTGVRFRQGTHHGKVHNCHFKGTYDIGVEATATPSDAITVSGCTIRQFNSVGIDLPDVRNTVVGNYIEADGTAAGTTGVKVAGNSHVGANTFNSTVTDVEVVTGASKVRLDGTFPNGVTDNGSLTRLNGVGTESANAETPTAANWDTGDVVDFTDSGDGTGNGVYQLMPDGTWAQIA